MGGSARIMKKKHPDNVQLGVALIRFIVTEISLYLPEEKSEPLQSIR